jgi:battenin
MLKVISRYFASGTGAAGLVGAFLWWELRKFGVRVGVGLSSVCPLSVHQTQLFIRLWLHQIMPVIIPLTYFFLLPHNTAFLFIHTPASYEDHSPSDVISSLHYTPLAANEDDIREEEGTVAPDPKRKVALSIEDKWRLVKPLLLKYMLPLCECSAFLAPPSGRANRVLRLCISSKSIAGGLEGLN